MIFLDNNKLLRKGMGREIYTNFFLFFFLQFLFEFPQFCSKSSYFQLTRTDSNHTIQGLWFHGVSWIMEKFKEGDIVALFGKIEFYQGFRIIHPEFDILDEKDDPINTSRIVPLYFE